LCTTGFRSPTSALLVVCRRLQSRGGGRDIVDYYRANQIGLPALAGQLGAAYAIPIIYVPLLMITHVVAFYLLVRPQGRQAAE
jgi:hypothetical protein